MGLIGLTGLIRLMGFIGLIRLMGLIKFKVKITKKGYRVNPYNLFAFKSAILFSLFKAPAFFTYSLK